VLVRTIFSGVSRGTEMLVHGGNVPAAVAGSMRAPFQAGEWPGPVKYGYLSVGVVEAGRADLLGQRVFCLFPHQDRYVVPASAVTPIPDDVPSRRAVLAGPVETAINALWEAAPRIGDRVAVVGAGMIGGSLAALLRTFPLGRVQLIDIDPTRSQLATALEVRFATPESALPDNDIVFHCSASESGINRSLELLGEEGEVIELSWYGTDRPAIALGEAFHSRRLSIRASQVGAVARARRRRRTTRDRLGLAVSRLADPVFDTLLSGSSSFSSLPETMELIFTGAIAPVCQVIDYGLNGEESGCST
jgi:threonine dehydrogenase-like Zn-dependent dehydrogenase